MARPVSFEFALVLALGVFWGLNWPTVKILLAVLPPFTLRATGLTLGAIGLAALALAMRQSLVPRREELMPLLVAGLLSIFGFNVMAAFGQLVTETSSAVIVAFTMPMWAAALSVFVLDERLTTNRVLALVVGMAGLAVLVAGDLAGFAASPAGPLCMLAAALSWAAGTVALKARDWSIAPMARATWLVGVSAPFAAAAAFLFEEPPGLGDLSARSLLVLGYHVIFPMIICHAAWVSLVGRLPVSMAAIGTLLIPVVGVASAALILGDELTASKLVALLLVLCSVALTFARGGASSRIEKNCPDKAREAEG
jgi:drug/metabolite transporter (DMT)-like permease